MSSKGLSPAVDVEAFVPQIEPRAAAPGCLDHIRQPPIAPAHRRFQHASSDIMELELDEARPDLPLAIQQELADRMHITTGSTPLHISLAALDAVERVKPTVPNTWKYVHVELEDWWQDDDQEPDLILVKGRVQNTGTWIAEDVTITVKAYNRSGLSIKTESTTLYGYLKPGDSENFEIKVNMEKIERVGRPRVTWTDVE